MPKGNFCKYIFLYMFVCAYVYIFVFFAVEPFHCFFSCLLLLPHTADVGMQWKSIDKEVAPSV